jgi:hypothetical protein
MMIQRALFGASVLALVAGTAAAQSKVISAGEKAARDNAPMGVRAGSFLIVPKVDVDGEYNDNIYATQNNEKSDFITTVRPEVAVKSNWSRHAVNGLARVETKKYADNNSEDQDNYLVALDGRADVIRDTSIGGGVAMARDHEERGNPNAIASGVEPTEFETMTGRVGLYRGLGKANARLDSEAKNIDYKNGRTAAGALVDNNLRDRNEYTQSLRLGYKVTPEIEGFVKGSIDSRVYDRKGSAANRNRSNHGQSYVAGAAFDMTGKTKGEVYAGVAERNYSDNGFKDISEPTFGGKVTWNFSELTTVKAAIDRGIEETTLGASSGYVGTNYTVGVEHALMRNVVLRANAGMANNEYKGFAANQREDDIITAGVGADYWFNRCFKAALDYGYTDRDSNVTGGDYSRNTVLVRLTATY